ncbi:hypothetical protein ACWD01_34245 [Streptomyces sp. NPDC002835]|jgi:hypothetical protein
MLVELVKVAKFPSNPWLAQIRTPYGHAAVRWCGDRTAEPGVYHVEWTVDQNLTWGRNAKPSATHGPGIRTGGHCVILRGRLSVEEDGAGVLDLGGALILLDLTDPVPEGVAGTWIELRVERERISLYPYVL